MPSKEGKKERVREGGESLHMDMSDPCEVEKSQTSGQVSGGFSQPRGCPGANICWLGSPMSHHAKNPIMFTLAGSTHGKHSQDTYMTVGTKGQCWSLRTVILPWIEV